AADQNRSTSSSSHLLSPRSYATDLAPNTRSRRRRHQSYLLLHTPPAGRFRNDLLRIPIGGPAPFRGFMEYAELRIKHIVTDVKCRSDLSAVEVFEISIPDDRIGPI